jgi:hypothetical protein
MGRGGAIARFRGAVGMRPPPVPTIGFIRLRALNGRSHNPERGCVTQPRVARNELP